MRPPQCRKLYLRTKPSLQLTREQAVKAHVALQNRHLSVRLHNIVQRVQSLEHENGVLRQELRISLEILTMMQEELQTIQEALRPGNAAA